MTRIGPHSVAFHVLNLPQELQVVPCVDCNSIELIVHVQVISAQFDPKKMPSMWDILDMEEKTFADMMMSTLVGTVRYSMICEGCENIKMDKNYLIPMGDVEAGELDTDMLYEQLKSFLEVWNNGK